MLFRRLLLGEKELEAIEAAKAKKTTVERVFSDVIEVEFDARVGRATVTYRDGGVEKKETLPKVDGVFVDPVLSTKCPDVKAGVSLIVKVANPHPEVYAMACAVESTEWLVTILRIVIGSR
jgi:hypothetical protein